MPAVRRLSSECIQTRQTNNTTAPYNPLLSGIKSYFSRIFNWLANNEEREDEEELSNVSNVEENDIISTNEENQSGKSILQRGSPSFDFAQNIQFEVRFYTYFF